MVTRSLRKHGFLRYVMVSFVGLSSLMTESRVTALNLFPYLLTISFSIHGMALSLNKPDKGKHFISQAICFIELNSCQLVNTSGRARGDSKQ